MILEELINSGEFDVLNKGDDTGIEITGVFCCDLLSLAMSRAFEGCAWVTVMGNVNSLAVASLTECACIILAEGRPMDEACLQKAAEQGITVLKTGLPVFDAALKIHGMINK